MEFKKIINDRRLLILLIAGPIVICLLFGLVTFHRPQNLNLTVFVDKSRLPPSFSDEKTEQLIKEIDNSEYFSTKKVDSLAEARNLLKSGKTRAILIITLEPGGSLEPKMPAEIERIELEVDTTDLLIQNTFSLELPRIIDKYSKESSFKKLLDKGISSIWAERIILPFELKIKSNEIQEMKFFDFYASNVIILMVTGICFLLAVLGITSDRAKKTIERYFTSPYGNFEIIVGKMLAYDFFAMVVAILAIITLQTVFDILLGNIFLVLTIAFLVGFVTIALSLLISSLTYSEVESVQLALIVFLAIMLLMTFLWPFEAMHPFIKPLSLVIPYTYASQAMERVNLLGYNFFDVAPEILILCLFVFVYAAISISVLKREIK